MRCENCKSANAEIHIASGIYYCVKCSDMVTEKLNKLGDMFDVIRDEVKAAQCEEWIERFASCIGSCEANGHSSCRCKINRN